MFSIPLSAGLLPELTQQEREKGGEERDEMWSQVVTGLYHTQETAGPHRDREVSRGQHLKQNRHHLMIPQVYTERGLDNVGHSGSKQSFIKRSIVKSTFSTC